MRPQESSSAFAPYALQHTSSIFSLTKLTQMDQTSLCSAEDTDTIWVWLFIVCSNEDTQTILMQNIQINNQNEPREATLWAMSEHFELKIFELF